MQASTIFGGTPVGSIASGQFAADPAWLPCDGGDYLAASYPLLDTTNLKTTGTNAWVARTLPASQIWSACAFGAGVFVAVSSTSGTVAASSADGATWVSRAIPSGIYRAVIYANGLFVAVGSSVCATSPDGITWTSRTIAALDYTSIAYGLGLFVAVSQTASNLTVQSSPDGITWTSRTASNVQFVANAIIFAANLFFVALRNTNGGVASSYALCSTDGINWSYTYLPGAASYWDSPCFFMGQWYIQNSAGLAYVSRDLFAWVPAKFFSLGDGAKAPAAYVLSGRFFQVPAVYASAALTVSADFLSFGVQQLPSSTTWGCMSFGNNVFVILQTTSASTGAASLAADTTKFRTPRANLLSDTDRLYIRAK